MFIRSTLKVDPKTKKKYYSYQLVESYRTKNGPRQRILLTINNAFTLNPEERKLLANRIEEINNGIQTIIPPPLHIEELAHSFSKQLIVNKITEQKEVKEESSKQNFISIDVSNIQHERSRSIGLEHICLETIRKLKLNDFLPTLGFTNRQVEVMIGIIIARLAGCGSELEAYQWLQNKTALEELLDTDFSQLSKKLVYNTSDLLIKKKKEIEQYLSLRETELFNLDNTIVLYDLTNTYFEGLSKGIKKAKKGRSKEKKSGNPLVTLGLALNSEGFPLRSDIYEGNISEPSTLKEIINNLKQNENNKPIIVLDAGIATIENIKWLRENKYSYIVCSKNKINVPDQLLFQEINSKSNHVIKVARMNDPEEKETILVCHSEAKEESELNWQQITQKRFEEELIYLNEGLLKKGRMKGYQRVCEKIGRLKENYSRIAQYYKINVETDDKKLNAIKIQWEIDQCAIEKRFSGQYCLRAYGLSWGDEKLWHTYIMLTKVEEAFRCLKNEIGLRPVYHQIDRRVDGHIFITLLSYHIMQVIQYSLRNHDIHLSWKRIRKEMSTQSRVTTLAPSKEKLLRIRGTTIPEPFHHKIYTALKLTQKPVKTKVSYH